MKRIISLIVGVVALVALSITPAFAHFSTYTGHGTSGFGYITYYGYDWNGCDWVWDMYPPPGRPIEYVACGHWHWYAHWQGGLHNHDCWMFLENTNISHNSGRAVNSWYNPTGCFYQ